MRRNELLRLLHICILFVSALAVSACESSTPTRPPEPISLRLVSVPHLGRRAQSLTDEFTSKHPYVTFELSVMPARDAMNAVAERSVDIGLMAEPISRRQDVLEATQIGRQAVVLAVHTSNPVDSLAWDQVRDVFSGQTWDWSAVDPRWEPQEIVVVSQHAGAVSRQAFEADVMEGEPVTPRALVATGDEVAAQIITDEPAAIGYLLVSLAGDTVKVLTVGDVTPTDSTVESGEWSITRPINLVTHIDANVYVLDFLDFAKMR